MTPGPDLGASFEIGSVATTSATDAWVVGTTEGSTSVPEAPQIAHWDGTSWTMVPGNGPSGPGATSTLLGVTARSATDAWAVGSTGSRAAEKAAIERWNGSAWTMALSPDSQFPSGLDGVAAISDSDAWAVGSVSDGTGGAGTLIEHWNGSCWRQVPPGEAGMPCR